MRSKTIDANVPAYLPSRYILSELFIDDAANGHDEGMIGHFRSIVYPQVVLKVLTKRSKRKQSVI